MYTSELCRNILATIKSGRQIGDAIDAPLAVREIGGAYCHINPAHFREFELPLHVMQERGPANIWRTPESHFKESDALIIERQGPQLFAQSFFHPRLRRPQIVHYVATPLRDGEKLYRLGIALRIAEPEEMAALQESRV